MRIKVAHTPDADDAFMFCAMITGKIPHDFQIENIVEDIEALNRKALEGAYDVTALSVHGYAYVSDKYRVLCAGASVGDGYGPVVVAKEKMELDGLTIAIPGRYTTASLLLSLAVENAETIEMRFDHIMRAILDGEVDAGVLIHEGQIVYQNYGLVKLLDLWEWWYNHTSLPLPLGINAIKRDLDVKTQHEFLNALMSSIRYAIENPEEAVRCAMKYGRGMSEDMVKKFATMYVNEYTLKMPESVVRAIEVMYEMAEEKGILKKPELDVLFPS
jgi:1,4-dihydroxy-6-naphthoate synthase